MVDIIVRARNNHNMTKACLRSIRHNTRAGLYRLILVDDGSDPPIGPEFSDVYLTHREACGAVTATNIGLAHSIATAPESDIVVMDNDTMVPDGDVDWLDRFIAELNESPDTGAIGATTNYSAGFQHILNAPYTFQANWKDEKTGASGQAGNPMVTWFVSFCVLLRKQAVVQTGLWDPRYNPGNYEDTDYSIALRSKGWAVRVARSVYIHHIGHQTFKGQMAELLKKNGDLFVEKWGRGYLVDMGIVFNSDERSGAGESSAP